MVWLVEGEQFPYGPQMARLPAQRMRCCCAVVVALIAALPMAAPECAVGYTVLRAVE